MSKPPPPKRIETVFLYNLLCPQNTPHLFKVEKKEKVIVSCCVYDKRYVCIAVLRTLVTGLLARSQYPEGPATGHLGTGFFFFFGFPVSISKC